MKKTLIIFAIVLTCFSATFAQKGSVKRVRHIETLISNKQYDKALSEVDQILQLNTIQNNDTLNAICVGLKGNILFNQEKYSESIPVFQQACGLFEKAHYKLYEYLDALFLLPVSYYRLEDYENAERYYRKALIKSVSSDVDSIDEYYADAYLNLGNLYKKKGLEKLAESCYEKAQSYNEQTNDYFKIWKDSLDKVSYYISNQQYQEAIDVYSEIIYEIKERIGKGNEYALAVYNIALLQMIYLNKFDEASSLFKEIIDFKDSLSFPNNEVCGSYCYYALYLAYKKDSAEIERILPIAISYLTQAHNEYYPVNALYRFVGNGAYRSGDYSTAIKYYEQYLAPVFQKEVGSNYDEITYQLANSYISTNKLEEAQTLLEKYLSDNSRNLDNNHELASIIFHNLGRAYMLQSNYEEALRWLYKSRDLQQSNKGTVIDKTTNYIKECESKL